MQCNFESLKPDLIVNETLRPEESNSIVAKNAYTTKRFKSCISDISERMSSTSLTGTNMFLLSLKNKNTQDNMCYSRDI